MSEEALVEIGPAYGPARGLVKERNGIIMEQRSTPSDQIIQVVSDSPGCLLEELVSACPDLTWNQVFLEVDRLSRAGQVQLTRTGVGKYAVRLPAPAPQQLANASSVRQQSLGGSTRHDRRE